MDAVHRALPTSCRNALEVDLASFLTKNLNICEINGPHHKVSLTANEQNIEMLALPKQSKLRKSQMLSEMCWNGHGNPGNIWQSAPTILTGFDAFNFRKLVRHGGGGTRQQMF